MDILINPFVKLFRILNEINIFQLMSKSFCARPDTMKFYVAQQIEIEVESMNKHTLENFQYL